MKALFRILIVTMCFVILYVYTDNSPNENELLEGPNQMTLPIPKEQYAEAVSETLPRPEAGISTYIGQSTRDVIEDFGLPVNMEPSRYLFEWWTYEVEDGVIMFSVENDIVTQAYTNAASILTGPYTIGQTLDDIYRMTILEYEIAVEMDDNVFLFSMSESDMRNRLLIQFDGVFAQLYIDEKEKTLYAVRYLDGRSLVLQQPYEMQYIGELLPQPTPSSFEQMAIHTAESRQLNSLANAIRRQYGLHKLIISPTLNELSRAHSEDMFLESYVSHDSPTYGSLRQRLQANEFDYEQAGENVATGYIDPIEVIHGWLNSQDHRKELLSEKYTHMGGGAYIAYYTQIFTKAKYQSYN